MYSSVQFTSVDKLGISSNSFAFKFNTRKFLKQVNAFKSTFEIKLLNNSKTSICKNSDASSCSILLIDVFTRLSLFPFCNERMCSNFDNQTNLLRIERTKTVVVSTEISPLFFDTVAIYNGNSLGDLN